MFRISDTTGVITLAQSFKSDPSNSYVIRVEAFRQNSATQRAFTKVRVFVTRNAGTPAFLHGNLEITITEDQTLGVAFINTNATDADAGDNGRITYSLSGSDSIPTYSGSYFFVNPLNGDVYVTRALSDDTARPNRYVVCI